MAGKGPTLRAPAVMSGRTSFLFDRYSVHLVDNKRTIVPLLQTAKDAGQITSQGVPYVQQMSTHDSRIVWDRACAILWLRRFSKETLRAAIAELHMLGYVDISIARSSNR